MIKSIELKNWKTHKDTRLDFSKGTNILIGQMGSGKSSIMDAISYALFGTFPSMQRKRASVNKLIRNKPKQEKSAYVKLDFSIDGGDYTIKRDIALEGKTSTATLEKNGAYLQSQPQRVTEEIERILKVDYDLFSKAVYSEQNHLDYFLDLSPTERKKQIDGLLGLDKFALAQENTTVLINRLKDMVVDTERIAKEFDIEKAKSDLSSLNEDLSKLQKEKSEIQKNLEEKQSLRTKSEIKLNSVKEQYNKKLSLSKDIEGLKSKLSILENEIKKIESQVIANKEAVGKELEKAQKELEILKKEESRLSESERKFNANIAKLEADINNANKDISEKEKLSKKISGMHKATIEKDIASCNSIIEQLSADIATSKAEISDAETQIKELDKHISKCPVCEREITSDLKEKLLGDKKKAIEVGKKKSVEYNSQLEKRRIELKGLTTVLNDLSITEEKLKGYAGIDTKIDAYKASLLEVKAEYTKIISEKDKSSKSILNSMEGLQKLKSTLDSLDRRERYLSEKKTIDTSLSKKTEEHNTITVEQKELDKLQEELVHINSEISKFKANLEASSKYIKDKELQINEKNSEIEKINKIKEDVSKKRVLIDNLTKFKMSLFETQTFLRGQLLNSINGIMHEVWQNLYPYGDYQSVTLDASDDDYKLRVKTMVNNDYAWEDVESIASGGERSTACLAMRIAFSLVLVPNLKWLILDEPTHNIDKEGLSKFVQVFSDTLPNIVDQVFIITHDDVLRQVNGAKIYSFSRNKEENKETEIAEL